MKVNKRNMLEQLKAIASEDKDFFAEELVAFKDQYDWLPGCYIDSCYWDGQKEAAQLLMENFPVEGKLRKELEAYASGAKGSHHYDPHCGYDDYGWCFEDQPWAAMQGAMAVAEELLESFSAEELSVERR